MTMFPVPTRMIAACCLAALGVSGVLAEGPHQNRSVPSPRVGQQTHGMGNGPQPPLHPGPPRGAHLGQWMQQHGNLSVPEQQRALRSEPGFNQLPAQTQQRMVDRLNRLNSMSEPQRERVIARGEALEKMSPEQRGNVRAAMGQLSALPQDRRRTVAKTFRDLRGMPVAERNALLNSPQYREQFSDEERGTLGNLLAVSPLLPPSR